MGDWVVIGVPSSAGAHHAGQDRAPDALRAAGLLDRLAAAGESVQDTGNLPEAPFAVDHDHPGARNLPAVARVAREVADAVAAAAGTGRLPLVMGGDCTITLGVIAGLPAAPSGRRAGLRGRRHRRGPPGLRRARASSTRWASRTCSAGARPSWPGWAARAPLLDGARLAIVGADPRETDDAGRGYLAGAGVSLAEAPAFIPDPAGAAARAVAGVAAASGPVVVHFDVDVDRLRRPAARQLPALRLGRAARARGRLPARAAGASVVRRARPDRGQPHVRRGRQPARPVRGRRRPRARGLSLRERSTPVSDPAGPVPRRARLRDHLLQRGQPAR